MKVVAARTGRQGSWITAFRRSAFGRAIIRRLPARFKRWLRLGRRWQRGAVAQVKMRWHRSLQLRVVSTTLLLSVLVIAVLGFFLVQSVAAGLLNSAENSADAQVKNGLTSALGQSTVNLLAQPLVRRRERGEDHGPGAAGGEREHRQLLPGLHPADQHSRRHRELGRPTNVNIGRPSRRP